MAKFFRKAALEKLSSPEKLDQLITIVNPRSWILLTTIGLILVTGISWGFMGKTKTKVDASGILLSGQVEDVVSISSGQLIELKIAVNDEIKKGQVVAIIDQPVLEQQIQEAEANLEEQQFQLAQLEKFGNQDTRVQEQLTNEQAITIKEKIDINNNQITFLNQQFLKEKTLLEKGLITASQVEQTNQRIIGLNNENKSLNSKITQVASQKLGVEYNYNQKITLFNQRINQTIRTIAQLEEQFNLRSKITSRQDGKILEISTSEGLMLQPGSPLFKLKPIRNESEEMRAILFISSKEGKKVLKDMEALIVPATVKPEEYGYIKGKISFVSEFPATSQGMMNVLKNEGLVRQMLQLGAPFEVHVDLQESSESLSGFEWTSKGGPPIEIFPGTPCSGKLTVKEQTPISIVMPALRKFFDLY